MKIEGEKSKISGKMGLGIIILTSIFIFFMYIGIYFTDNFMIFVPVVVGGFAIGGILSIIQLKIKPTIPAYIGFGTIVVLILIFGTQTAIYLLKNLF